MQNPNWHYVRFCRSVSFDSTQFAKWDTLTPGWLVVFSRSRRSVRLCTRWDNWRTARATAEDDQFLTCNEFVRHELMRDSGWFFCGVFRPPVDICSWYECVPVLAARKAPRHNRLTTKISTRLGFLLIHYTYSQWILTPCTLIKLARLSFR